MVNLGAIALTLYLYLYLLILNYQILCTVIVNKDICMLTVLTVRQSVSLVITIDVVTVGYCMRALQPQGGTSVFRGVHTLVFKILKYP